MLAAYSLSLSNAIDIVSMSSLMLFPVGYLAD